LTRGGKVALLLLLADLELEQGGHLLQHFQHLLMVLLWLLLLLWLSFRIDYLVGLWLLLWLLLMLRLLSFIVVCGI